MCRAIEVSKSGFYDWLNRKMSERKKFNLFLLHLIKEIHTESEDVYGGVKIHRKVLEKGYYCSLRLVEKLMKIAQISSITKAKFKPSTTDSNHNNSISPNLLNRNFTTNKPNEVWVSDITYIEVGNTWMYLCVIIDLFNREVIGWSLDTSLETKILVKAFMNAIKKRKPSVGCIFHSDRGIQYASKEFRSILEKHNMIQSMSRKGNCWDNAVAECFFKIIKTERVYHRKYQTYDEANRDLFQYIEIVYNRKRIHSYLNFTSPAEFIKKYYERVA